MKSGPHTRITGPPSIVVAAAPRLPARLSLHPEASPNAGLDGTWWPRSLDLSVELPALIEAAATRLDQVSQASYHPGSWNVTVRHLVSEGRVVRLAGEHTQPADVITLTGADQQVLSLLVMPPDADGRPGG
jgi:hypothetical protein